MHPPSVSQPKKMRGPLLGGEFFNVTPTTEIYTRTYPLSLHDALP
eukprot:COSAG04_NODE_20286_length_397_cov_0.577181_1_plen_44_part_10